MAEQRITYLPETSEEARQANEEYRGALQRLTTALQQRQFTDPGLVMAKAFGTPGRTGSFFEGLGNVAAGLQEYQSGKIKEEQEIAKLQADIAAQRLGMERQRMLMSGYEQPPSRPPEEPAAPQGGALPAAGKPPSGPLAGMSKQQFMQEGILQGIAPAEREVQWTDYQNKIADLQTKGMRVTDKGRYDYATGQYTPFPSGATTSVRIFGPGQGKVYDNVPDSIAARLSELEPSDPEYIKLANRVLFGGAAPPAQTGALPGAPTAERPAEPPSRVESASEKAQREAREKMERDIEEARRKEYESTRAKGAAEAEVGLPVTEAASGRIQSAAKRVENLLSKSPEFFGIFNRPGVIPAIGELVSKGIKTPGGTLELAGFENAIRQTMPGVKPSDLDNVTRAAADLAEIELAYTQLYMQRQGAITEGERAIVRRLGGTTSDSPTVLRARMELLKNRSEYDLNRIDAFRRWKENNPNKTILDFDSTADAKRLKSQFAKKMDKLAGIKPTTRSPSERLDEILGGR